MILVLATLLLPSPPRCQDVADICWMFMRRRRILGVRILQVLVLNLQYGIHLVRVLFLAKDLPQLLFQGSLPGRLLVEYFR